MHTHGDAHTLDNCINTLSILQFYLHLAHSQQLPTIQEPMMDSNPPLQHHYGALLSHPAEKLAAMLNDHRGGAAKEECQLPLIDLSVLRSPDEEERLACVAAIARAASEWGFFQVVNHGISPQLRWGSPRAKCPNQFSWSEAFHIPLTKISDETCYGEFSSLREATREFVAAMSRLARLLAGVLVQSLGHQQEVYEELCDESTCFLRLNHYPPCSLSTEMFGLVPHTDSDFLTILYQDQVGGLQLKKNSKWVPVKPKQDALVVNIGDLFQAWSNDVYKSVEHKVMANEKVERYSIAYFLCPSNDSQIGSHKEPSIYRKFTFREYRNQIQEDVKKTGHKVGLPRFLL